MEWKERVLNLSVAVMALCAVTVTAIVVRREFFPPAVQNARALPTKISDWERFADRGQWIGSPRAPVRVVVFSDFQCPACQALFARTAGLQARYPGQLGILYRHYPLANHPHAREAATAAECAAEQGRFEQYHALLFQHQDSIGTIEWSELARRAGVTDVPRFDQCLQSPDATARVRVDAAAGDQLGIEGTPTSIVNGFKVTGVGPALDSLLDKALQGGVRR